MNAITGNAQNQRPSPVKKAPMPSLGQKQRRDQNENGKMQDGLSGEAQSFNFRGD